MMTSKGIDWYKSRYYLETFVTFIVLSLSYFTLNLTTYNILLEKKTDSFFVPYSIPELHVTLNIATPGILPKNFLLKFKFNID